MGGGIKSDKPEGRGLCTEMVIHRGSTWIFFSVGVVFKCLKCIIDYNGCCIVCMNNLICMS